MPQANQPPPATTTDLQQARQSAPASGAGNSANKSVVRYDFEEPRTLSRDQIQLLTMSHQAFARELSVLLSNRLRMVAEAELGGVESCRYSDFVSSCGQPSALFVLAVPNYGQQIVVEVETSFASFALDRLLGGQGVWGEPRLLSPIERGMAGRLLRPVYTALERAWEEIAPVHLAVQGFESNADFVQIVPRAEPVLVVRFTLNIGGGAGAISICYPYLFLKQVIGRTGIKQWLAKSSSDTDPKTRDAFSSSLQAMDVELRAELGRVRMKVADLLTLKKGDVIPLKRRAEDAIEVVVGRKRFQAALGKVGLKRAIRFEQSP